jgi:hypothetical protein
MLEAAGVQQLPDPKTKGRAFGHAFFTSTDIEIPLLKYRP